MNVTTMLYFSIFHLLTSNFEQEKIYYVQFNGIVLQSNQIAFQKNFWIKKYQISTELHLFLWETMV